MESGPSDAGDAHLTGSVFDEPSPTDQPGQPNPKPSPKKSENSVQKHPASMDVDPLYSPTSDSHKGELPPESILSATSSSSDSSDSDSSSTGSESPGTRKKVKKALAKMLLRKHREKTKAKAKKKKNRGKKELPKKANTQKKLSTRQHRLRSNSLVKKKPNQPAHPGHTRRLPGKRLVSYELCKLFGGEVSVVAPGSFRHEDGINRLLLTLKTFLTAKTTNMSYTYNYGDL